MSATVRSPPLGAIGDRQAIPALIELADKPESRFAAGNGAGGAAGRAGASGLSSRFDRQEQRATQSVGRGDRQPAGPGGARARAARAAERAVAGGVARAAVDLRRSAPVSSWKVLGPFPLKGVPRLAVEKPVELSASFEGRGRQAGVVENRQGGRSGRADRPGTSLYARR